MDMSGNKITVSTPFGDKGTITLETGLLASGVDGSVLLRQGKIAMLATVVIRKNYRKEETGIFLCVDYREKPAYGARDGNDREKHRDGLSAPEVLVSRGIDRAIRRLLPTRYDFDVHICVSLISEDRGVPADCLATMAASAAVCLTNLPFDGPVADVRITKNKGKWIINPDRDGLCSADMDLMVTGTGDSLLAVEGDMSEFSEMEIVEAMKTAHCAIKEYCMLQEELSRKAVKKPKGKYREPRTNRKLKGMLYDRCYPRIREILDTPSLSYIEKKLEFKAVKTSFWKRSNKQFGPRAKWMVDDLFVELMLDIHRNHVLEKQERMDGRTNDRLRPIYIERGFVPAMEGGIFYAQGDTQIVATALVKTWGGVPTTTGSNNRKCLDCVFSIRPYISTPDNKPLGIKGRRLVAYGDMMSRALERVMVRHVDGKQVFVETEVLQSNGSASVACIPAASLALQESGAPFSSHTAAVSIGILVRGHNHTLVVDLLNEEERISDIIIKVVGTRYGITGFQLRNKRRSYVLDYGLVIRALEESRSKIEEVLLKMSIPGLKH